MHDTVGELVPSRNVGVLVVGRDEGARVGNFVVTLLKGANGAPVSTCVIVGMPVNRLDGARVVGRADTDSSNVGL